MLRVQMSTRACAGGRARKGGQIRGTRWTGEDDVISPSPGRRRRPPFSSQQCSAQRLTAQGRSSAGEVRPWLLAPENKGAAPRAAPIGPGLSSEPHSQSADRAMQGGQPITGACPPRLPRDWPWPGAGCPSRPLGSSSR